MGLKRRGAAMTIGAVAAAVVLILQQPAAAAEDPNWQYFPKEPKAPAGAPNVLLIMTDDVGFSDSTSFGGAISTPTFDSLAGSGLHFNEFHVTAMCSPSRAALLTGRNHHRWGQARSPTFRVTSPAIRQ